MSIPLLWWAHSGLSTLLLGGDCGPIHVCRYLCFGGPIQDYRRWYSAVAMGPFMNVDTSALVGPFRIIDAGIRRDYGPIQVCRHCCFGGPIHDYRRRYSAVAMGPFMNVDTSALAGPLRIIEAGIRRGYGPIQVCRHCCFGGPVQDYRHCYSVATVGPFMNVDTSALVGPFGIIDAGIRRWLWAHSGISTLLPRWAHSGLSTPVFGDGYGPIQVYRHCCFGGPTQDYRRRYSAMAMGPFRYIDIAASVGPLRIIDAGIRRWLWAHSGISTLLPRWAHSGLSTPVFGVGYGPIQVYRRCCLGGPIHDYRLHHSAAAVGPFENIDVASSVGPLRIIDAGIRRWLWAHSDISTL